MSARHLLLELFDAALRAVDGRACVEHWLRNHRPEPPLEIFAVGKAASAMARGAIAALGDDINGLLIITKDGHRDPELDRMPRVRQIESAHPLPDGRSLSHGAELEQRVAGLPSGVLPLFLISGGASSLVESPREGVSLNDLSALTLRGLEQGWDIGRLNAERSKLSRIKGGGIAQLLGGRRALALFISDVPGDDPAVIGSGLLGPDPRNSDSIERHVVASIDAAMSAARAAAQSRGLMFESGAARFSGDAAGVAENFITALRASAADGLVWGGESTVELPARHGRGGRNTHLALLAARQLRPGEPFSVLAAGTDGTDGATSDAGALIDAGSVERAELGGCDVERALREFDSGSALEAAGDLVHTGPTGTNVGDILIGFRHSAHAFRGREAASML